MKTKVLFHSAVYIVISNLANSQLANQFPNDIGIEAHPNIIFADMFEQSSITQMLSLGGYLNSPILSHINFDSSVPAGSTGSQSLKLTTVESSTASNDPNEDANILKKFSNGISDSVFVRYYIKYNSTFSFHHSGVWMGGTDPANNCWPCNTPGRTIPTSGDSAFVVGSEIRGLATQSGQNTAPFGFYNYWMDMHPFTSGPAAGQYYGNEFISPNPVAQIDMNAWHCMEIMIKLNNPADSSGLLKLWIDGQLVGDYGQGFPNGTWNQAIFTEGNGNPFEGFRFRSNPNVVFNYVWLKNYATNNTNTNPNDVLFDHLVVAKEYIGPISVQTNSVGEQNVKTSFDVYPNPVSKELYFSKKLNSVKILNQVGQTVFSSDVGMNSVNIEFLTDGLYFLQAEGSVTKFCVKK